MRELRTIAEFVAHMRGVEAKLPAAGTAGLTAAALIVEREAKAEIGHYQDAAGPFPAWAPLSDATMEGFHHPLAGWIMGREALGYGDEPLEREGHLRDSITHIVEGHAAAVGSDDPVAEYQENGTPDALYPIPPRSFLGGAAVRKTDAAVDTMVAPVVSALAGTRLITRDHD